MVARTTEGIEGKKGRKTLLSACGIRFETVDKKDNREGCTDYRQKKP